VHSIGKALLVGSLVGNSSENYKLQPVYNRNSDHGMLVLRLTLIPATFHNHLFEKMKKRDGGA